MRSAKSATLAAAALALLALPALAHAESPLAQLRAGAVPAEIECGADLILAVWAGRPACVREQTAERLGLELLARVADAPAHSDSAAHEARLHEIRAHVLAPVSEAEAPEPARIPVPPPERREPVESLSSFRGEPVRITMMVDPDRTGYVMPITKADNDELVERFAAILGETLDYTAVQNDRDPDSSFVEVTDDFDFLGDFYNFYYFTDDAVFTTVNTIFEDAPFAHNPPVAGPLQYTRYFSSLSSVDHMEFIARFMDEMDFDGWTVYDPYDKGSRLNQYNYEYYLFRGTHLDDLDTSVLDRFYELGPYVADLEYLPEVESGQIRVSDVLADYEKYRDRIIENAESWPLPKKTALDGFGAMSFRFDGGSVIIKFSGWSNDPAPDPVISPKYAIERAVEFAKTDETLSGPRCGLNIPDRSVEDEPRYIELARVGGMPYWKVLVGSCETRYTMPELLRNYSFRQLLGDSYSDVSEGRKTIKLDDKGDMDLTSIGLPPLGEDEQNFLNHLHDIDVAIYVDAIDGKNAWLSGTGHTSYSGKLHYQTHLTDDNVWFLEDGQVVFAEDWPSGYPEDVLQLVVETR